MAKQGQVVEYGLFVRSVAGVARPEAGSRNKIQFLAELQSEYPPQKGWEIVSAEFGGFIGPENAYTVILVLQRRELGYVEVAPESKSESK